MIAHAREQGGAIRRAAGAILEDPARGLTVPDERVADDEHAVLRAELDITICGGEIVLLGLGMNKSPFHHVFGRDRVELLLHECGLGCVLFGELGGV